MILKIRLKWLKAAKMSSERISEFIGWNRGDDDRMLEIDHEALTRPEFEALVAVARKAAVAKEEGSFALEQKLGILFKLLTDAAGARVTNLQELEAALNELIRHLPNGWFFREVAGVMLPVLGMYADYDPPEDHSPASTTLHFSWYERGSVRKGQTTWGYHDIIPEAEAKPTFAEEGAAVDDDADADDAPKKKKSKKGGRSTLELLQENGFMPETKEAVEAYYLTLEPYERVSNDVGGQYVASGNSTGVATEHEWADESVGLAIDGVPRRLVIDDHIKGANDETAARPNEVAHVACKALSKKGADKSSNDGITRRAPLHPFVLVFDLTEHQHIKVLANLVVPYTYNDKAADRLILADDVKAATVMLIDGAAKRFNDIIAGKSLGTFVLSTGPAGTGKTLMAECYSERLKRPLYTVQCSQLGTDEVELEQKLLPVLRRAQRWKAILLIDEADVYVRERGTDIQQNAIVGVFLRLLERYRGIIFMTSNLNSIDDAIYSRATAHIRFVLPDADALAKIFVVQLDLADTKVTDGVPEKLAQRFVGISGRTAKQLVRLAIMWAGAHQADIGGPDALTHFEAISKFQRLDSKK